MKFTFNEVLALFLCSLYSIVDPGLSQNNTDAPATIKRDVEPPTGAFPATIPPAVPANTELPTGAVPATLPQTVSSSMDSETVKPQESVTSADLPFNPAKPDSSQPVVDVTSPPSNGTVPIVVAELSNTTVTPAAATAAATVVVVESKGNVTVNALDAANNGTTVNVVAPSNAMQLNESATVALSNATQLNESATVVVVESKGNVTVNAWDAANDGTTVNVVAPSNATQLNESVTVALSNATQLNESATVAPSDAMKLNETATVAISNATQMNNSSAVMSPNNAVAGLPKDSNSTSNSSSEPVLLVTTMSHAAVSNASGNAAVTSENAAANATGVTNANGEKIDSAGNTTMAAVTNATKKKITCSCTNCNTGIETCDGETCQWLLDTNSKRFEKTCGNADFCPDKVVTKLDCRHCCKDKDKCNDVTREQAIAFCVRSGSVSLELGLSSVLLSLAAVWLHG